MILRIPSYYKQFRCIADKCTDNCCIGWEIDIDSPTAEFYSKVKGEFGKKLKENIAEDEVCSFILNGERCPFLNEDNLCEIIINLGEECLCQICSDHPRYYEWFDGVKEGGIGLCCQEAARIILSQTTPLTLVEEEIPDEYCDEYNGELYNYLVKCREIIIRLLEDKSVSLEKCLSVGADFCIKVQESIDRFNYMIPSFNYDIPVLDLNITNIAQVLLELEPMDENWKPMFEDAIGKYEKIAVYPFTSADTELYLRNIAVYFIWRYFMKAVFDEDVISKVNLMIISVTVISYLFEYNRFKNGKLTSADCAMITGSFSKEIEYSEENTYCVSNFDIL